MAEKTTEKNKQENAMDVVNSHIASGEYAKVYLFYGEERYLVEQYKNKLILAATGAGDKMNFESFSGSAPDTVEIIEFSKTMPFLADKRVVLVEQSGLFKSSCEDFAEKLEQLPSTALILFVETEVDKRGKLYKEVNKNGCVLEFSKPDERTLLIWSKSKFKEAGKKVEDQALYSLMNATNLDMNSIRNEIDKLIGYCFDKEVVTAADVNTICVSNTETKIFDMVEAIARKQQDKALHLYHELIDNKEPALRILYLITRQFDMLLKTNLCIKEGKKSRDIAKTLGVIEWVAKKYMDQVSSYTYIQLKDIVERCQEEDYKIKRGLTVDTIAVELLIISFSRRE